MKKSVLIGLVVVSVFVENIWAKDETIKHDNCTFTFDNYLIKLKSMNLGMDQNEALSEICKLEPGQKAYIDTESNGFIIKNNHCQYRVYIDDENYLRTSYRKECDQSLSGRYEIIGKYYETKTKLNYNIRCANGKSPLISHILDMKYAKSFISGPGKWFNTLEEAATSECK